jgi:hypothetical protein
MQDQDFKIHFLTKTKKEEKGKKGYSKPLFVWVINRAHLGVMTNTRRQYYA